MQTPLEINFHDVPRSQWSADLIEERAAKLERFADDIISCLVIVSQPARNRQKGNPHRVSIEVRLPRNRHLMVVEEPKDHDDSDAQLRSVIQAAFSTMERRLKNVGEPQRRGTVRPMPEEPQADAEARDPDDETGQPL